MLEKMRTILSENPTSHVVAAVSGGMDSMSMLHALKTLQREFDFQLTAAHFDHAIRPDSQEDARLVAQFAAQLDVPLVSVRQDVSGNRTVGQSLEEAARIQRYAFLQSVDPYALVATAHHANDLAETVLMNLMRGAGTRGLRGMLCRRDAILRPMLFCTQEEVRDYATAHHIPYREDVTNADVHYTRNRIRHTLLPLLQKEFNPRMVEALVRTACASAEDEQYLDACARLESERAVQMRGEDFVVFSREVLCQLPPALQKRVLRNAAEALGVTPDALGINRMAEKLQMGGAWEVGDGIFWRCGRYAELYRPEMEQKRTNLLVPGTIEAGQWAVQCAILPHVPKTWEDAHGFRQYLDLDALCARGVCSVRTRREGDVFAPLGLKGHTKTVSDFMTDKQVPFSQRDRIPLLLAGESIAWVVGFTIADWAKVKKDTKTVCKVEFLSPKKNILPGGSNGNRI